MKYRVDLNTGTVQHLGHGRVSDCQIGQHLGAQHLDILTYCVPNNGGKVFFNSGTPRTLLSYFYNHLGLYFYRIHL